MAKLTAKKTSKPNVSGGYTAPGYDVPKGEDSYVHAPIEMETWGGRGVKQSKDLLYKTNVRQWNTTGEQLIRSGFTIHEILHLPKGAIDLRDTYKDIK